MEEISDQQLFDLFSSTLAWLDQKHLNLPDEELLGIIHEELSIDAVSFLHTTPIELLSKARLIPSSIISDTAQLREEVIGLIENKGTIQQIRFDKKWIQDRATANMILEAVKTHQLTNKI